MVLLNPHGGLHPAPRIYNNIFYSDGASPYLAFLSGSTASDATLSNNLYFNHGAGPKEDAAAFNGDPFFLNAGSGNFHVASNSIAIDHGTSGVASTMAADHDGIARPQGAGFDIGVYER